MISKQCLKCGQTASINPTTTQACPHCGAIYSKVEAAAKNQTLLRTTQIAHPNPRATTDDRARDSAEFLETLRTESIYPAFRAVTNVLYWCSLALGIVVLLGGLWFSIRTGALATIGIIAVSVLVFIFARVGKKMSLMLADMSDATVRMAARSEKYSPKG